MPVLAREETALERVLALNHGTNRRRRRRLACIMLCDLSQCRAIKSLLAGTRKQTYLLAAVESLTFFPSKDAKCCSRASSRLLGA